MKKIIALSALSVLLLTSSALAFQITPTAPIIPPPRTLDTPADPPVSPSNQPSVYTGSSGKQYEYDLSKPVDQIHYDTDIGAQNRDYIDPDPRRDTDEYMGQRGGGAIRD